MIASPLSKPSQPPTPAAVVRAFFFFFFCIYYSVLRAHTKRCRCISVSPSHAKKALKKTAGATTWLGHGSADVQHFSPPHSLAFADHRFFAGFNNFRVKLASFPSLPWLPFCLCLSRCAVCLGVGPALISRIAHQLSPTVSSLSPPLALSPTHFSHSCRP